MENFDPEEASRLAAEFPSLGLTVMSPSKVLFGVATLIYDPEKRGWCANPRSYYYRKGLYGFTDLLTLITLLLEDSKQEAEENLEICKKVVDCLTADLNEIKERKNQ